MRLFCSLVQVHMYLIFTMPLHEGEITRYGLLGAAALFGPCRNLFMTKSNIFFHCNGKEIDQDNVQ